MAIRKKAPPRPINVAARSLGDRKFAQRVVKNKKTYDRKRRDAEGLAPFHLPAAFLPFALFSPLSQRALPGPNSSTAKSTNARTLADKCCVCG